MKLHFTVDKAGVPSLWDSEKQAKAAAQSYRETYLLVEYPAEVFDKAAERAGDVTSGETSIQHWRENRKP